eukprot:XP_001703330.1 predicted protein [Chlamydomonas reinhardtii]
MQQQRQQQRRREARWSSSLSMSALQFARIMHSFNGDPKWDRAVQDDWHRNVHRNASDGLVLRFQQPAPLHGAAHH